MALPELTLVTTGAGGGPPCPYVANGATAALLAPLEEREIISVKPSYVRLPSYFGLLSPE